MRPRTPCEPRFSARRRWDLLDPAHSDPSSWQQQQGQRGKNSRFPRRNYRATAAAAAAVNCSQLSQNDRKLPDDGASGCQIPWERRLPAAARLRSCSARSGRARRARSGSQWTRPRCDVVSPPACRSPCRRVICLLNAKTTGGGRPDKCYGGTDTALAGSAINVVFGVGGLVLHFL